MAGPRYDCLDAGCFKLPSIIRGPDSGPVVVIAPPLFEEMNRCRNLLANLGRALEQRQIATILPDLPGSGDNVTSSATLPDWRSAFAALVATCVSVRPTYVFALRGGALLTDGGGCQGLYRYSPARSGQSLLRDLVRAQAIADQERTGDKVDLGDYDTEWTKGHIVRLAGYDINPAMAAALSALECPAPAVKLRTAEIDGPAVWRQAEPADSTALAEALAADFVAWIVA